MYNHFLIFLFQALNRIPLIQAIINWVINFIVDTIAPWIIERGGWVSSIFHIGLTLCLLMDSSFWFDAINLEWSIM